MCGLRNKRKLENRCVVSKNSPVKYLASGISWSNPVYMRDEIIFINAFTLTC